MKKLKKIPIQIPRKLNFNIELTVISRDELNLFNHIRILILNAICRPK